MREFYDWMISVTRVHVGEWWVVGLPDGAKIGKYCHTVNHLFKKKLPIFTAILFLKKCQFLWQYFFFNFFFAIFEIPIVTINITKFIKLFN